MRDIRFSVSPPGGKRVHHVTPEDISVLLDRLPAEVKTRLRVVHLNDRAWGNRVPGYVTSNHREIALCALPPRVSLTRFLVTGQTPETFGALRNVQWPELAVRRFLLYDVFLHELGHLQVVDPDARSRRNRFAREGKAQEFADAWRRKLWRWSSLHPDPVHDAP